MKPDTEDVANIGSERGRGLTVPAREVYRFSPGMTDEEKLATLERWTRERSGELLRSSRQR